MQYANFEITNELSIVIDANELALFDEMVKSSGDDKKIIYKNSETDKFSQKIVYGSYHKNANVTKEQAIKNIANSKCKWLVHINHLDVWLLAFTEIKTYPMISGNRIPFSALIDLPDGLTIGNKSSQAISAFVSYKEQMDIGSNLINRNGLFAFKSEEKRIPKNIELNDSNWLDFVKDDRAINTAYATK